MWLNGRVFSLHSSPNESASSSVVRCMCGEREIHIIYFTLFATKRFLANMRAERRGAHNFHICIYFLISLPRFNLRRFPAIR